MPTWNRVNSTALTTTQDGIERNQKLADEHQPVFILIFLSFSLILDLEQAKLVFISPILQFPGCRSIGTFQGQFFFQSELPLQRYSDKGRFGDSGFFGCVGQPMIEGIADMDLDLARSI